MLAVWIGVAIYFIGVVYITRDFVKRMWQDKQFQDAGFGSGLILAGYLLGFAFGVAWPIFAIIRIATIGIRKP